MLAFVIRVAVAISALTSIKYSSQLDHVDVAVPIACVTSVSTQFNSYPNSCFYKDVSIRGHIFSREYEVYNPRGGGFYTKDAVVRSDAKGQTGFTWRSLVLILIALTMWVPSLASLFKQKSPALKPR